MRISAGRQRAIDPDRQTEPIAGRHRRSGDSLPQGSTWRTPCSRAEKHSRDYAPNSWAKVEELTGGRVTAFMSTNHVEPDVAAQILVLDRPVLRDKDPGPIDTAPRASPYPGAR